MLLAPAVHGDAWNIPDDAVETSGQGVRRALDRGWRLLRDGATALDVVEQIVRTLEDDPHSNAGWGSRLNQEGRVEMDASITEGGRPRAAAATATSGAGTRTDDTAASEALGTLPRVEVDSPDSRS